MKVSMMTHWSTALYSSHTLFSASRSYGNNLHRRLIWETLGIRLRMGFFSLTNYDFSLFFCNQFTFSK